MLLWSKIRDSYKILHIVDNKTVNEDAVKIFLTDFSNCQNPADKLSGNYSPENFNIEGHEMFDALYTDAGQFVACTGIFSRAPWQAGMYRLLNRTYFNPQFRTKHGFSFFASDYLLPAQIERCKSPLDFTFVSRQGVNGGNFLKRLQQRPFFKEHYQVSSDYIQVAAGLDQFSFQKILFYKKNPQLNLILKSVTDLQSLPEGIKDSRF